MRSLYLVCFALAAYWSRQPVMAQRTNSLVLHMLYANTLPANALSGTYLAQGYQIRALSPTLMPGIHYEWGRNQLILQAGFIYSTEKLVVQRVIQQTTPGQEYRLKLELTPRYRSLQLPLRAGYRLRLSRQSYFHRLTYLSLSTGPLLYRTSAVSIRNRYRHQGRIGVDIITQTEFPFSTQNAVGWSTELKLQRMVGRRYLIGLMTSWSLMPRGHQTLTSQMTINQQPVSVRVTPSPLHLLSAGLFVGLTAIKKQ